MQSNDSGGPAREEKYNTRFLVSSLRRDSMLPRLIIIGVGAVILGGLLFYLFFAKPEPPSLPASLGGGAVSAPATPAPQR
jgi:hypothetical protein